MLVEKKDGTTGFTWGSAGGVNVGGSLVNQNGASAVFVDDVSACTTSINLEDEGTCTLTVSSDTAGSASVSATAAGLFPDLPNF